MVAREADAVGNQTRQVRGAHPGWRHARRDAELVACCLDHDGSAALSRRTHECCRLCRTRWRTKRCSLTSLRVDSREKGSVLPSSSLPLQRLLPVSTMPITFPGAVAHVPPLARQTCHCPKKDPPEVDTADEVREDGPPRRV